MQFLENNAITIPSTIDVFGKNDYIAKYQTDLNNFVVASLYNYPQYNLPTDKVHDVIDTIIHKTIDEEEIGQHFIGKNLLYDPSKLSTQVLRLSLNYARKHSIDTLSPEIYRDNSHALVSISQYTSKLFDYSKALTRITPVRSNPMFDYILLAFDDLESTIKDAIAFLIDQMVSYEFFDGKDRFLKKI